MAPLNPTLRNVDTTRLPDGATFLYFSQLYRRPVVSGNIHNRLGKLRDLVFALKEPYPDAVGIYMDYGWGKPTQFVPWDRVLKIEDDAIFVRPPETEDKYPPFVDQPGWIMVDQHLMGRTILDMDGRRIEVVNDVHLLEASGHLLLVHVDTSFNGFLRRWGFGRLHWIRDNLIPWKVVQPLSVEDAAGTDKVSLSVTRRQLIELPSEDLADALEELKGKEQEALFSALDSEKAAETLIEAEPRAQRQLIARLRRERAGMILGELSVPQLVNLFTVLPHDDTQELLGLLPTEEADHVRKLLAEREATARTFMSMDYVTFPPNLTVGQTLAALHGAQHEPESLSYLYVVREDGRTLEGVVDLRELVLSDSQRKLADLMVSPVVSVEETDSEEDLAAIFVRYQYRMIPVVDAQDRILGVIRYDDIMRSHENK